MSEPLKKKIQLLEFKGILHADIDDSIIEESLHVFSKQYEIAELLSNIVVECIKTGKNEYNINISRYGLPFNNVTIHISKTNLMAMISANISNVDDEGNILINIYTTKDTFAYYTERRLYKEIRNSLAHELEHAYTILSTYKNTGSGDKISGDKLYADVCNIIHESITLNDVYYISYAIYSTYGHEMNAFVSQCYGEIYDQLITVKQLTNETIKTSLKKSTVYNIFLTNISNLKEVLHYSNNDKTDFIRRFNSELQIDSNKIKDSIQLDKLLNNVLLRNEEAVKYCHGVAMKVYYDLTDKK